MINCIIVDDEQHAIDILVHYVNQAPQLSLVGCYLNPLEALSVVNEKKVDLVFLDVLMPELSGIDFIKTIQGKCKVILTTAYRDYALEGYDLHVTDYLLKPIRMPRFLDAIQKVVEQTAYNREHIREKEKLDYIFVKTESKGKLVKIELADIVFIEGMKNYVAIHAAGKKTLVNTSMKSMEEQLSGKQFIRVHKSFIISLSHVSGIEGSAIRLKGIQQPVVIGDIYRESVMQLVKAKMVGGD